MHRFTEYESQVLESLATYQYLTVSQIQRLGIGTSRANIRDNTLSRLKHVRPALIKFQDFGVIAGIGRLEHIYFLSQHGVNVTAEFLRCDPSEIIFPRFGLRFKQDYFHRKMFVDFHISLRKWIDQGEDLNLEFFNSYYTKTKGQNSRSINMFRFKPSANLPINHRQTIEPDGVFRFRKDDKNYLCAVEIHRKADSKYITKQLDAHMTAIDQNLIPEQFEHPTTNLVLSVHESLGSFKSVQERLMNTPDFRNFLPLFHFNLVEYVNGNFKNHWITADGKKSKLFL